MQHGFRLVCILSMLAASACDSEPDCAAFEQLVSDPSAVAPGAVRGVIRQDGALRLVEGGAGMCRTCAGVLALDADLAEVSQLPVAAETHAALGSGGTLYVADTGATASPAALRSLSAFAPDGTLRWKVDATVHQVIKIRADADTVYLETEGGSVHTVYALDAATGAERFMRPSSVLLGTGVIMRVDKEPGVPATVEVLDAVGDPLWEHDVGGGFPTAAVRRPDGGIVVVGAALADVVLPDRTLELGDSHAFAYESDAAGAVQWAFAFDALDARLALSSTGEVLLQGYMLEPDHPLFVAVAAPAGLARMHVLGGRGIRVPTDFAAGPDGAAWITVDLRPGPSAVTLLVGDHVFEEPGAYLVSIVP
jgi:hypothetical protein